MIKTGAKLALIGALSLAGCRSPNFALPPTAASFAEVYTTNNKVDILWVMDDSGSMASHQANLATQFSTFVDLLLTRGIDFHIAVTTMDASGSGEKGRFLGTTEKVLSASTGDLKSMFSALIQPGSSGSSLSRGFDAVEGAFSSGLINGVNAGFLRSDAQLAIIFISDDNDSSAPSPAQFEAYLDNIKPLWASGDRAWFANFIGVLSTTSTCTTGQSGFSYSGDRFMQVVADTGGVQNSICSTDLTGALSNIRDRVVSKTTNYVMARAPLASSITVTINGTSIPNSATNGWTFSSSNNTLYLHGTAVPAQGADVEINYQPTTSL